MRYTPLSEYRDWEIWVRIKRDIKPLSECTKGQFSQLIKSGIKVLSKYTQ
jgi:hypothetical protein